MDDLTVSDGIFEKLEGGQFVFRVFATGTGFDATSRAPIAMVGDVPVEQFVGYPDGLGFSGLLASVPPDGAVLRVGWTPDSLLDTPVVFSAPPIA
jgi:hypothetical protein